MTQEEKQTWLNKVAALQQTYYEYNLADKSFRCAKRDRARYEREKERAVLSLKSQLKWPPFAEYTNNTSPFAFAECFDSLDTYMENAIKSITNRNIEL
ncbi:MAG: hypothetical protein K6G70_08380 [Bacteroidaceae bacterium]|nr:hypothetical protein [Bacteroidaceae bacterium]